MSDYPDYNDPAWDEYLNTGVDPTGGDLGLDDYDETVYEKPRRTITPKNRPATSSKAKPSPYSNSEIVCMLLIAVGIILGLVWLL